MSRRSGRPASGSSSRSPAARRARRCCAAPPGSPGAPGRRTCSACTCCAATAWHGAGRRAAAAPSCAASPRTSARRSTRVVGDDVPAHAARVRPRRQRHPARARHLAALPVGAAVRPRHRRRAIAGLRAASTCTWSPTPRPGAARGARGCSPARRRAPRRGAGRAAVLLPVLATVLGVAAARRRRPVHRRRAVLPGHGRHGAGRRARPGAARGARRRPAAQLLPDPAAVHVHRSPSRRTSFAIGAMVVVAVLVAAGRRPRRPARRSRPRTPAPRRRCSRRSPAPCSPAPTRCPGCSSGCARRSGSPTVALLERAAGTGWDGHGVHRRRPVRAPRRRRRGRRDRRGRAPRRLRPHARRGRARACSTPSAGRRCSRCATGGWPPQAADAQRRADATELRTALLSAVGHDLRTPADRRSRPRPGSLRDPALRLPDEPTARSCSRPSRSPPTGSPALVDNLLDSSRLATGAVTPCARRSATTRSPRAALRRRRPPPRTGWCVEIDEDLPDVLADAGLPSGSSRTSSTTPCATAAAATVAVRASAYADRVELRVVDAGPGVPARAARPAVHPVPAARRPAAPRPGVGPRPARRARVHRGDGRHARRPRTPRAAGSRWSCRCPRRRRRPWSP